MHVLIHDLYEYDCCLLLSSKSSNEKSERPTKNILITKTFSYFWKKDMSATLHTSLGDIKVEIFCDTAPRTAFNFLALAASNSYDGTEFHR